MTVPQTAPPVPLSTIYAARQGIADLIDRCCALASRFATSSAAMRISVLNWSTDESDVDRSVEAILRCASTVE